MEDILSIVVLILYFVIAGASGKNKKKKAKARRAASRRAQFDQAFDRLSDVHKRMVSRSLEDSPPVEETQPAKQSAPAEAAPCHEDIPGMHLHTVTQREMERAGEGSDPCHVGRAKENEEIEESPVYCSPIFDAEDKDAFAQDVLRGVVMSEVLARPSLRRGGKVLKRGA